MKDSFPAKSRTELLMCRLLSALILIITAPSNRAEVAPASGRLFPAGLPSRDWRQFLAAGFSVPVTGVVYRNGAPEANGVPLGGIDTGCLDLDLGGTFGYMTIFNSHVPRRGPLHAPLLGLAIGNRAWIFSAFGLPGVAPAKTLDYWGHYPVADLECEFDGPVDAGLRAWCPFLPGDTPNSMVPGAVFEVRLRNKTSEPVTGTLGFSFPGFDRTEVNMAPIERRPVQAEALNGVLATGGPVQFCLAAMGNQPVRIGRGMGWDGDAWRKIAAELPRYETVEHDKSASSIAADFKLAAKEEKTVRFVLTWCSPNWKTQGGNMAGGQTYTHMYATRYPNAVETAKKLVKEHESLLRRILAWQEVIYADTNVPGWLQDSLINNLHLITETGLWAQAVPPVGSWCRKEDGVFGMNECPRSCPQIECIPCSFYGNIPLVYFFPDAALSTLRAYKAYQYPNGRPAWIFGAPCGMAEPSEGYQFVLNGSCLVEMIDKMWLRSGDDNLLKEFYECAKKATVYTMTLRPEYGVKQVISMPAGNVGQEWYESLQYNGMASHVGGIHLAHLRMMKRMAEKMGDGDFARRCDEWFAGGSQALEEHLWAGTHYLLFFEPETGSKSDVLLGYVLDGQWMARFHGLPGVFREERVKATLDTLAKCNANPKLAPHGALVFAKATGTKASDFPCGYWTDSGTHAPGAMMLGMTYMYEGNREFGLDQVHRVMNTIANHIVGTWDSPILFRADTGDRIYGNDYYQDMMLWSVPAALAGQDLAGPAKPGGLVDRILRAARQTASPSGAGAAQTKELFATGVPASQWVQFKAEGFSKPACGVVYRLETPAVCGMPLGGIDTGCIDLETSGLWGYCTIFNTHVPRRGPLNLPFLGISVGGQTWVLCDPKQTKPFVDQFQPNGAVEPVFSDLKLPQVRTVREIHYWGHYPVADLEFETDGPVRVALRAWSPFLPGDVTKSLIPGIISEVHLRNPGDSVLDGTIAFSFPGPTMRETGGERFERRQIQEEFLGVEVKSPKASYALGTIGAEKLRSGGELGADGAAWAQIAQRLPEPADDKSGASVAVNFHLGPREAKIVRFVLTWNSPQFKGGGHPSNPRGNTFTHRYVRYYPTASATANELAKNHDTLLRRVLAWQQVVYAEESLPVWLRESLVNNLHLFAECSVWVEAIPPIPSWVRPEDGLHGLIDAPRHCPGIEPIPCSFYGHVPLMYFFPKLALSTLRGHKGLQWPDGDATWIFGSSDEVGTRVDFAEPCCRKLRGRNPQVTLNGLCYAALVDRYLRCWGNDELLKEFYDSVKKNMVFTMDLASSKLEAGDRVLSMPDEKWWSLPAQSVHWFEATDPPWFGIAPHVGGLHLAQLRIAERLAREVGDEAFAQRCRAWIEAGSNSLESRCWQETRYLHCLDPVSGKRSDLIFGYQLDGQWVVDFHGLPGVFRSDRVKTTLETIRRANAALSKTGATNYANPDGTLWYPTQGGYCYGTYGYFPPEVLMLAMTYMYEGQRDFGLDLARRCWENIVCTHRYAWDMPNITRPDQDTGERWQGHDYYQNFMLWALPAALAGQDVAGPGKPGGLVDRIVQAARRDGDSMNLPASGPIH